MVKKRKKLFWAITGVSGIILFSLKCVKTLDKLALLGVKTGDVNSLLILFWLMIVLVALRISGYVE